MGSGPTGPSPAEIIAAVTAGVMKLLASSASQIGVVAAGYTPGSDVPVTFGSDTAGSTKLYKCLLDPAAVALNVGDTVAVEWVGTSQVISGKIGTAPAPSGLAIPTGSLLDYAGSSAPSSAWLICDGSAVSRTTYANLFAVCSTTYGAGDGSTTFNLPNVKGRSTLGVGDSGTAGHTNHLLGGAGGEETHLLSISEIPSHTHTIPSVQTIGTSGPTSYTGTTGSGQNTGSTGGGAGGHNTMHPYLTVNKIIKT
jgi:microcystin-dependent protein